MKKIIATVLAMVMALALCATAFAAPDATVEAYVKGTDKAGVLTDTKVALGFYKANAPTVVDNKTTKEGNVAYYTYTVGADTTDYVVVATLGEADLVAYSDAAGKNAILYLAEVTPEYYVGKVFTNFGKKCGQIDFTPVAGTTYYVAEQNGVDNYYYSSATGTKSLMVDGKLVAVEPITFTTKVGHTAVPTVKDGKVTGYTCKTCGAVAIEAPNYLSIPAGADNFTGNWYFPAAGATTTTTTSSPKTFDAGIAMYVGMALTSVAGSAVVIGKKKEF